MKFQDMLIKISVLLSVIYLTIQCDAFMIKLCMRCEVDVVVINEWDMFCATF